MRQDDSTVSVATLMASVAAVLPQAQSSLDDAFLAQLQDFRAVAAAAENVGLEAVARAVFPQGMAISSLSTELQVALVESRSRSFELAFRLAGIGFKNTFRYTQKAFHTLTFHFQSGPFPPGHPESGDIASPPEI